MQRRQQTIPDAFFEGVNQSPDKAALLYKKGKVYFPITYQELSRKIKIFAACLQKLGTKEGDKVAILSENRPEWVIADFGAMLAGGVVVPIHTTLNPKVIKYILDHAEVKILIVSNSDLLHKVFLIEKDLHFLEDIVLIEKIAIDHKEIFKERILGWEEFLSLAQETEFKKIELEKNGVCSIIYTSGTTGIPKGVMLTHNNFLSNARAVSQFIPIKKEDVFLSFLPLSHVLERLAGHFIPLLSAATIAYAESPKNLAFDIKEVKPTILISVPRVFEKINDSIWDKVRASSLFKKKVFFWATKQKIGSFGHKLADFLVFRKMRKQLGGGLRLTISGGASLNPKIARFFLKIRILILEGYGLTETSPVVSVNLEKNFRFGTVGKVLPGLKVKISSDKEILIQGPNVMKGYFKDPEATTSIVDKDGWFHSGDLGFIDNDGFLTIIGRKKEMIVTSGGKNVWPEPIEHKLDIDRFIYQSMVVGNKRKFISALIVPDWDEVSKFLKKNNLPIEEPEKLIKNPVILDVFQKRIEKINQELSDYEQIKKFRLLTDAFSQERDELTPTLKLRRHIIEKHCQKEIEGMYGS